MDKPHWEINNIINELDGNIYFEDGKFKAPILANDIIFHFRDLKRDTNVNRGWLVTNDNQEIFRYNGNFYQNSGKKEKKTK